MFSEEVDDLKVNEAYAARFNRRERSKELQGLRREHSKEVAQTEEHSSASEDEDGVLPNAHSRGVYATCAYYAY